MPNLCKALLILLIFSSGCKKDELVTPSDRNSIQSDITKQITIDECKKYFDEVFNNSSTSVVNIPEQWEGLVPSWPSAQEVDSDTNSYIIVPIADVETMFNPYLDSYVTFYQDSLDSLRMHLVYFRADSSSYLSGELPTLENFTGIIYEFWIEIDQYSAVYIEDGIIKGCGCDPDLTEYLNGGGQPRTQIPGCRPWTIWEWAAGVGGSVWRFLWNGISWGFTGLGNLFNGIWAIMKNDFPSGSNGGLNGWQALNVGGVFSFGFESHYGPNGGNGGGPAPGFNINTHFSEFDLKRILDVATWMNSTYGVNLTQGDLLAAMPLDCIWLISTFLTSPNFGQPTPGEEDLGPECSKAPIISMILAMFPHLTVNDEVEIEYLLYNPVDRNALRNFTNGDAEKTEYMKVYIELKIAEPDFKWARFNDLWIYLSSNNEGLIQECADEANINLETYSDLYNFDPPANVINSINSRNFSYQPIEAGNSALTNVDEYSIEITTMPDIDGNGSPDTYEQVFNGIRSHFLGLASGSELNFEFSCDNPFGPEIGNISWDFEPYATMDATKWNSSNPVNTVFKIPTEVNIPTLNFVSDNGSIVISQFESCCWIGSSIHTPFSQSQPYSGNRQWGYKIENNKFIFYTKAIDVATRTNFIKTFAAEVCASKTYYDIADVTWTNLQEELQDFIIFHGGNAIINAPKVAHYDTDQVRNLLKTDQTIQYVPCD